MMAQFNRQSFLGADSECVLRDCRVAVVGLGGGGSHIVQQLAHVGVGNFLLFDPDHTEDSNLNRLVGATWADVAEKILKTEIARRLIMGINPNARIDARCDDWRHHAQLLRDRDVVFGCVDTLSARRDLEAASRRYLIPYIDIGMDVHELDERYSISGQVALSMPGKACMRCMGILSEEAIGREARNYGAAGGKPQVIWPNGVLASTAVGVFMQLVTPWHDNHSDVLYYEYEGNNNFVGESARLHHAKDFTCRHFQDANGLGDPFWLTK